MTPDRDLVQKALDEFSLTDHGDQCYIMFHALNGQGNAIIIQRDGAEAAKAAWHLVAQLPATGADQIAALSLLRHFFTVVLSVEGDQP
jgi:hypothetical protein